MKRLFELLIVIALVGCGKDKEEPKYNENLVGKKFRAASYVSGTGAQIYDVMEFKSASSVLNEYRTVSDSPISQETARTYNWRKEGVTGTGITIEYFSIVQDESEAVEIKGIITEGILSFPGKPGETVYEEYQ